MDDESVGRSSESRLCSIGVDGDFERLLAWPLLCLSLVVAAVDGDELDRRLTTRAMGEPSEWDTGGSLDMARDRL